MKSSLTNIAYPLLAGLSYPLHGDVWFIVWMLVMGLGSAWMHWRHHVTGKWTPADKAPDYAGMYAVFVYLITLELSCQSDLTHTNMLQKALALC